MNRRWILSYDHKLEDRVTGEQFYSKDRAYVEMCNVLYNELQELKETVNELKNDSDGSNRYMVVERFLDD